MTTVGTRRTIKPSARGAHPFFSGLEVKWARRMGWRIRPALTRLFLKISNCFGSSSVGETKWYEYAARFMFGGLITAIAGVIAKTFGPVVGGLFLAFPAIFPASATLIEKHERRKARREGKKNPELAGRRAVAVDAAGAALGSVALFAFAFVVWQLEPLHSTWLVLPVATLVWISVSLLLWWAGDRLHTPGGNERSQNTGKNEARPD